MAIAKMKRISIIGNMKDLDAVTTKCCHSEVFHPEEIQHFENADKLLPINEENPYEEWIAEITEALTVLHKKPELIEKTKASQLDFARDEAEQYVQYVSDTLMALRNKRTALHKSVAAAEEEISNLQHFTGQEIRLDEIRQCEFIKVRFGSIPQESYKTLKTEYKDHPYVTFFPCTNDVNYVWGLYFCPIDMAMEIDRIFSRLYFKRLRLRELSDTPAEMIKSLQEEIKRDTNELGEINKQGETFWQEEGLKCQQMYSWLVERSICFNLKSFVMRYNDSFILTGWVPAKAKKQLTSELDSVATVEYSFSSDKEEARHSPPVMLNNHALSKPYEFFVDMYGLPNYNESDPTKLMSILFTLMFGMMFADVGQGICIALIGYFLMWKKKHLAIGKILLPCGISGAVFGLIFGSVFGFEEALNPLYHLLGFAEKPIEVMNGDTVMQIIIASIGIGFVCLSIAMIVNIVTSFRRGNLPRALFSENGIAGFVFYWALVLGFVIQMLTGKTILTVPYIIGLIIVPLLVIFFKEVLGELIEGKPAKPEKIGEYLIQSFFELFEVLLSLLSNTVSFLRIGAFVLVHSGMMLMIMSLADMMGPVGSLGFVIMVVFGNIFVSVLETLLVCIHVLRLQYYEMFSRFYDGDGRPFHPITIYK
ncbi:V-type ATP synthase subunit I [Scatolibacter rhodanostii]|uniref:V-type ATP synthase subunit I n=1 Tax=Scatolibacter rhodanostii TaxID=2014781 RepID=UPI000C075FC0|nr:V-type ATPase 116kDa subunit family protein [Scatolibacter rhodanostii]